MTELNDPRGKKLTLTQAAEMCHVTRQAFYIAMKKGHLKGYFENNLWYLYEKDIQDYREGKYDRHHRSTFNGEPLFNDELKELSVSSAAKYVGENTQYIYYLLRSGRLPHTKKGTTYIIKQDDLVKMYQEIKGYYKYISNREKRAS